MTPQEYLEYELKNCSRCILSDNESKALVGEGLKEFLFKQITRKEFRRWKLPDPARDRISEALDFCIQHAEPITFRFRFGGYKLWRLEASPEVDWAEFFALAHYARYIAPILSAYKPGVKIIFASDDVFVERLNNISKNDTEAYLGSFKKLLSIFKRYFPDNFTIEILRHSDLYDMPNILEQEFDASLREIEIAWKKKSQVQREKDLVTSVLNIKWDGVEDLTKLSEAEKKEKIERSAMMHDALIQLPTIRNFTVNGRGMILFFSTQTSPRVIAIGTTKASVTKFWTGIGVLKRRHDAYLDYVLSPRQIISLCKNPMEEYAVNLVSLKNFSRIKVYNTGFDFSDL